MTEFYGYVLIAIFIVGLVYFITQMILSYLSRVSYSSIFDDLSYFHQGNISHERRSPTE